MRQSTDICLLLTPTRRTEVSVDEQTGNCLCEIPNPLVLPDAAFASTSCNFELDEYVTYRHPEFESVARLPQGFAEAKTTTNAAFKELCEEVLKSKTLKEQVNDLTQRIFTLTFGNESLLKRTFELTEYVCSLTAITSAHCRLPVFQRMLLYHIEQLPLTTDANTASHHLLLRVLGCAPSFSQEILTENIRCLLQQLHLNKNLSAASTTS